MIGPKSVIWNRIMSFTDFKLDQKYNGNLFYLLSVKPVNKARNALTSS